MMFANQNRSTLANIDVLTRFTTNLKTGFVNQLNCLKQ